MHPHVSVVRFARNQQPSVFVLSFSFVSRQLPLLFKIEKVRELLEANNVRTAGCRKVAVGAALAGKRLTIVGTPLTMTGSSTIPSATLAVLLTLVFAA